MAQVETIDIELEGGTVARINATDFDQSVHKKYAAETEESKAGAKEFTAKEVTDKPGKK